MLHFARARVQFFLSIDNACYGFLSRTSVLFVKFNVRASWADSKPQVSVDESRELLRDKRVLFPFFTTDMLDSDIFDSVTILCFAYLSMRHTSVLD